MENKKFKVVFKERNTEGNVWEAVDDGGCDSVEEGLQKINDEKSLDIMGGVAKKYLYKVVINKEETK